MRSSIALLAAFMGGVLASSSEIGKSYHIYHKLGNDAKLTSRGTIKIAPSEEDDGSLEATFQPDSTSELDATAFDNMVENNALYTVLVTEEGANTKYLSTYPPPKNVQYVSASVPGCSLRRSNLREEIGLSISPTGKLLSVSYRPLISPLAPKTCTKLKPLSDKPEVIFGRKGDTAEEGNNAMPFKTTVSFDSHKPMMAIPTVIPQQRPPPGLKWYRRNAKNNPNPFLGGSDVKHEGGGNNGPHIPGVDDEQPSGFKSSFLYRYWYIILPLAIMGLFGGVDEEELEKHRAAQQQARGGGGAAAAGGAGAGGAQARQRRGKRD